MQFLCSSGSVLSGRRSSAFIGTASGCRFTENLCSALYCAMTSSQYLHNRRTLSSSQNPRCKRTVNSRTLIDDGKCEARINAFAVVSRTILSAFITEHGFSELQ